MKKGLNIALMVLLVLALAAALGINAKRVKSEEANKTLGILVDYDEVVRLTESRAGMEFEDMLAKLANSGAGGLVVRERTLTDWEGSGDVIVIEGSELRLYQELALQNGTDQEETFALEIKDSATYILTKKAAIHEEIYSILEAKRRYPESFEIAEYKGISLNISSGERSNMGLGFPIENLKLAAAADFAVVPRLRSWEPVRGENLETMAYWLGQIPGLAAVGFNDMAVPGGSNPQGIELLAQALSPLGKPLVSFEFYDQAGLAQLADAMGNELLRAHAIAENELKKYSRPDEMAARFSLGARERNIRYLYIRFTGLDNPVAVVESNLDLIKTIKNSVVKEGFTIGKPETINSFSVPFIMKFIAGLGVISAGLGVLILGGQTYFTEKAYGYLSLLGLLLACIWAVALLKLPILGAKIFALGGAVLFPTLSMVFSLATGFPYKKSALAGKPSLRQTIVQILAISLLTLAGAIIMSALLADVTFMLKLNSFAGVKLAHLLPLILVPALLWINESNWFTKLKAIADDSVKLWQLAIGLVILLGLAVYIMRTGNDSLAAGTLETKIRLLLDRILGVRPRTKEFLIGHPALMVLLYYGYSLNLYPLLLIGLIGQISLINTYAHIHTPLLVSLQRTGHGLWLGILGGIVLILMIEAGIKHYKKGRRQPGEEAKGNVS